MLTENLIWLGAEPITEEQIKNLSKHEKYPWNLMEVGDKFQLVYPELSEGEFRSEVNNLRQVASQCGRRKGRKFSVQINAGFVEITRIK